MTTAAVDDEEGAAGGAAATSLLLSLSTEAAGRASRSEWSEICLERTPPATVGATPPASAGWEGCTNVVVPLQPEPDTLGRLCWPRFR